MLSLNLSLLLSLELAPESKNVSLVRASRKQSRNTAKQNDESEKIRLQKDFFCKQTPFTHRLSLSGESRGAAAKA